MPSEPPAAPNVRLLHQGPVLVLVQMAPLRTRIFGWMLCLFLAPLCAMLTWRALGYDPATQHDRAGGMVGSAQVGLGLVLPLLALGVLVLVGRSVAEINHDSLRLRRYYRLCGLRLADRESPIANTVVRVEQEGDPDQPTEARPKRWLVSLDQAGSSPGLAVGADGQIDQRGLLLCWSPHPAGAAAMAGAVAQHLHSTVEVIEAPTQAQLAAAQAAQAAHGQDSDAPAPAGDAPPAEPPR